MLHIIHVTIGIRTVSWKFIDLSVLVNDDVVGFIERIELMFYCWKHLQISMKYSKHNLVSDDVMVQ